MVPATPSGSWLQSSPVVPELSRCLGTRMQMLWLEEGVAVEDRFPDAARTALARRGHRVRVGEAWSGCRPFQLRPRIRL